MAGDPVGAGKYDIDHNEVYNTHSNSSVSYSITTTGVIIDGVTRWTYSGSKTFLGLSTNYTNTQPDAGFAVGDSGTSSGWSMYAITSDVTNLTNTTWQFNASLTFPSAEDSFTLNFTSNGSTYSSFEWDYGELYFGSTIAYDTSFGGTWSQNYRLVTVTGGTDATNSTLISFFTNNATLMGNEYIAMDWELTDIADAIRSKRGISTSLSYPSDFVSNIKLIQNQKLTTADASLSMGDDITLYPMDIGDYDGFSYVDVTVDITPYDGSVTVTGGGNN